MSIPPTFEIPGLCFRAAHTEADIAELARTETYGERRTNLPQVLDWWRAYPRGNLLAVYESRIVGGMDIWPVQAAFYDGFVNRRLDEADLDPGSFALDPQGDGPAHWYVGSISLQRFLPARGHRQAMLLLLENCIAYWETLIQRTPAHIVAQAWTSEGRNLLRRSGWTHLATRDARGMNDAIFEYRVLSREEEARRWHDRLRSRLGA